MKIHLLEGGQGSGNFGHEGRPGKVGGSSRNTTISEEEALEYYQGLGYFELNYFLRYGDFPKGTSLNYHLDIETALEMAESIDNSIKKGPILTRELFVYRGRSVNPGHFIGQEFEDKGFVSTSLDAKIATEFRAYPGDAAPAENSILYRIKLPRGFQCLLLKGGEVGDQKEVLLPRKTKFVVRNIQNDVIDLEITK